MVKEHVVGVCFVGGGVLFAASAIRALISGSISMTTRGGFKRRYERSQGSPFYSAVLEHGLVGAALIFFGVCFMFK